MGMSLDAEIMYGMVLFDGEETITNVPWRKSGDDEGEWDEDEEKEEVDFEDWIAVQLGLEPLDYSTYPERINDHRIPYMERYAKEREMQEAWGKANNTDAYYAKKRELLATVPVEEDYGGTDGFHSIVLRLKGLPKIQAYYGPKEFDPDALAFTNEEMQRNRDARDFLARYGVEWAPKWLLVPSYG